MNECPVANRKGEARISDYVRPCLSSISHVLNFKPPEQNKNEGCNGCKLSFSPLATTELQQKFVLSRSARQLFRLFPLAGKQGSRLTSCDIIDKRSITEAANLLARSVSVDICRSSYPEIQHRKYPGGLFCLFIRKVDPVFYD